MQIKNLRNNKTIDQILECKSPLSLANGLMFRKKGRALLFFPYSSKGINGGIWTPFMRFSIDLAFLDENKKIVEIKEDLRPWRIYNPKEKVKYVLEVESELLDKFDFQIGDELEFKQH